MPEKYKADIPTRQPTSPEVFFSRRKFISSLAKGILLYPTVLWATSGSAQKTDVLQVPFQRPGVFPAIRSQTHRLPEGISTDLTPREIVAAHNNFYEFLPGQGGPVWLYADQFEVDPWKYGYKSPKSIVKIEFVARQPKIFWQVQPHEYGFLSNVNPNIPHPRWSQEQSYWLYPPEAFPTPIFNGYDKYVGHLYPDEPRTPQEPLRPGQIAR